MPATLSTLLLDPILREHVIPLMQKQFQERLGLYNWMMEGTGEEITSKGCKIPAYVQPPASNAWVGEGGTMPEPSSGIDIAMRVRYTRYRRSFQITGDALRQLNSADLVGSVKGLGGQFSRLTDSAQKAINQELYGSGSNVIAIVATSGVDAGNKRLTWTSSASTSTFGAWKTLVGQTYNLINPATGLARVNGGPSAFVLVATAVDRPNRRTTFGTTGLPSDAADGDYLVWADSYNRGITGLATHVDDSATFYQGVSRSDYDALKALVIDAGGGPITNALFSRLDLEAMHYHEEDAEDFQYVMPVAQRFQYELLGHTIRTIEGIGPDKYDGGFKEVSYNGHNFVIDVDAPRDRIYKLRRSSFMKLLAPKGDFRVFDDDGLVLHLGTATNSSGNPSHADKYNIYFAMDGEFACNRPAVNSVIKNLSYSSTVIGESH